MPYALAFLAVLVAAALIYLARLPGLVGICRAGRRHMGHLEYGRQHAISVPLHDQHHAVDLSARHFECDFALPIDDGVDVVEFEHKRFPDGRHFKTTLGGAESFMSSRGTAQSVTCA